MNIGIINIETDETVENYKSEFCPRIGEVVFLSDGREYRVLEVFHMVTTGLRACNQASVQCHCELIETWA